MLVINIKTSSRYFYYCLLIYTYFRMKAEVYLEPSRTSKRKMKLFMKVTVFERCSGYVSGKNEEMKTFFI